MRGVPRALGGQGPTSLGLSSHQTLRSAFLILKHVWYRAAFRQDGWDTGARGPG